MKISGHNLKDVFKKTGYALIITLLVIASAHAESKYKIEARKYATKWCLNFLHETFKPIKFPKYNGNIYMTPEVDRVTRRKLYIEDMRDNRKVFMFIIVYEF